MEPPVKKKRVPPVAPVPEPEELEDEVEQGEAGPPALEMADLSNQIAKLLKYSTFEPEHRYWLDTGSEELNTALGSKDKGIAFGTMLELYGPEHGGKTTIGLILGGMAQRDGAAMGYVDLEDSRDPQWATKLGCNWDQILTIYPKLVVPKVKKTDDEDDEDEEPAKKEKKKKKLLMPRTQSVEEIFAEAEMGMALFHKAGYEKQYWLVDSIANMLTESVLVGGATGQNMRTVNDRPMFLSLAMPRWIGLAANYNAMIVFVNQLRTAPGVMFGNPERTPGGRAVKHNCKIRAGVRRVGKGRQRKAGRTIGVVGLITNVKNKAGEGSVEGMSCGFRILWNRPKALLEFMSEETVKELYGGKEDNG
jgi:recombination protein RecA